MPAPTVTIEQILWAREIEKVLRQENPHLNLAKNDNQYLNGNAVVVPQAGNLPTVAVNPTSYPRSVTKRTDTKIQYDLKEYELGPIMVEWSAGETLSYDKLKSILDDVSPAMTEFIGDMMAFDWAPQAAGANVLYTTGSASAVAVAGQTGTRKAPTKNDLINVKMKMDIAKVPQRGRVAMIPPEFQADFLKIADLVDADKTGRNETALVEGAIARVLGFDIMVRPTCVLYDASYNALTPGTVIGATDNHAALFWHPNFVRRAFGTVKNGGIDVIINPRQALYGGADLIDVKVRYGGTPSRPNNAGIFTLAQAG